MVLKTFLAALGHTEDDTFLRKTTFVRKIYLNSKKTLISSFVAPAAFYIRKYGSENHENGPMQSSKDALTQKLGKFDYVKLYNIEGFGCIISNFCHRKTSVFHSHQSHSMLLSNTFFVMFLRFRTRFQPEHKVSIELKSTMLLKSHVLYVSKQLHKKKLNAPRDIARYLQPNAGFYLPS